jgi:hypothetical protein
MTLEAGAPAAPERRFPPALLLAVAALAAAVAWLGARSLGNGVDYVVFHVAGRTVLAGDVARLYDPAWVRPQVAAYTRDVFAEFLYPPAYALVFAPLALLPIAVARALWALGSLAALAWAIRSAGTWSRRPAGALAALALLYAPLLFALVLGQTTAWMMLALATIVRDEWRGRPGLRAGAIAGCLLCKPHLVLPLALAWLVTGRWRRLLGMALAAAVVGAVSALLSVPATLAYLRQTPALGLEVARALQQRGSNGALLPYLGPAGPALAVAGLVGMLLVVRSRSCPATARWSLPFVVPMLVTPHLGAYDLALGLVPISVLFAEPVRDARARLLLVVVWLAPIAWAARMEWAPGAASVALCAVAAWRGIAARRARAAAIAA